MIKINKTKAVELMNNTNGKVFSAEFIKKDATKRHINCRTGVKKHVKGVGLKFKPNERGLFNVFDMKKNAYRFININSLLSLKIGGETYKVGE